MSIDGQGIHLGFLYIRFYGVILMSGAMAAAYMTAVQARRKGQDSEVVWDGLLWVLIAGILGARIWHILTPPPSMVEQGITTLWYLTHPLDMLAIWRGGLGIPGAVIGGMIALYVYCRKRKYNFLMWCDLAAPGLALAQGIGRWGNFVNQEIYGAPSNLPWAIRIDPQFRLPEFANVEYYHPLFLYESLWNFANFGILLWLSRNYSDKLKDGDLLLTYAVIYPIGRFLLEFLRLDSSMIAGVNANQVFMLVVALAAGAGLFWRHRKGQPTEAEQSPEEPAAE